VLLSELFFKIRHRAYPSGFHVSGLEEAIPRAVIYSPIMRGLALLGILPIFLQPALSAPDAATGRKLFAAHCAACHGQQGQGGRGARLTSLTRASDDDSLFNIIRKGIPGPEMPPAPLSDDEVRDVAAFVRSLGRGSTPTPANGMRGAQIYLKAGCASCHTIGSEGGVLGPDLSHIGARRRPDYLRRALLEPEADIPESFGDYRWYTVIPDNFLQVRVTTVDGRAITGARVNEDAFSIQLRDVSGRVYSLWKEELKELHKDWGKSPMPSFRDRLTATEIEDLVSYLASLQGGK
jgi:putative heme-binding domain-containing protein